MSPFAAITAACVAAASISVATSARSSEVCDSVAELVQATAEARDAGVPKAAVMVVVGNNEPLVAGFLSRVAEQVYDSDLSPTLLREVMRVTCEDTLQ